MSLPNEFIPNENEDEIQAPEDGQDDVNAIKDKGMFRGQVGSPIRNAIKEPGTFHEPGT